MQLPIRYADRSDAETISKLVLEASETVRKSDFSNQGWEFLQQTNTLEVTQARFDNDAWFALIYEVDSTPVAYLAMLDYQKIDHLFVLADFRQRGIAGQLWKRAHDLCVQHGHGSWYWVRSSSIAVPVYESFGFKAVGQVQSSNGISFQPMERGLKAKE